MARKLNKLKLVLTIFIFLLIIIILSYFTLKVEDIIEISKEHSLSPRERINKRCYENVFIENKTSPKLKELIILKTIHKLFSLS